MNKRPLGELGKFINGAAFKPEDWGTGGLPIIRIQNLTGSSSTFNFTLRPVKPDLIVERGDLLVSWSATLGVYRWSGPRAVLNQHIFKVLPANDVHPQYLFYVLQAALAELNSKTHGSTMKHVVRGDFENTTVPVPPMAEQQRIVDILDRAAGIQRLRKAGDEKVRELVPALFVDLFGDPASNPKGWELKPLKEVSQIGSGITKGRKLDTARTVSVPYLRVANVQDGKLDLTEIKTIAIDVAEREKYALWPGDIVMTEGGDIDKLGRGYVWQGELPYCAHQNHVFRVRVDENVLHSFFLSTLIGTSHGKSYFLRVAKRTTGIASINKTQLGELPVWLPPISLQRSFARTLETLRSVQQMADRAATTIEATAATLSAQLLS